MKTFLLMHLNEDSKPLGNFATTENNMVRFKYVHNYYFSLFKVHITVVCMVICKKTFALASMLLSSKSKIILFQNLK